MARYFLRQNLAHIKLFIAANNCVNRLRIEVCGKELGQVNHSRCGWRVVLPRQIQTAANFFVW